MHPFTKFQQNLTIRGWVIDASIISGGQSTLERTGAQRLFFVTTFIFSRAEFPQVNLELRRGQRGEEQGRIQENKGYGMITYLKVTIKSKTMMTKTVWAQPPLESYTFTADDIPSIFSVIGVQQHQIREDTGDRVIDRLSLSLLCRLRCYFSIRDSKWTIYGVENWGQISDFSSI